MFTNSPVEVSHTCKMFAWFMVATVSFVGLINVKYFIFDPYTFNIFCFFCVSRNSVPCMIKNIYLLTLQNCLGAHGPILLYYVIVLFVPRSTSHKRHFLQLPYTAMYSQRSSSIFLWKCPWCPWNTAGWRQHIVHE